jgi:hypothetical protein
MVNDDGDDDEDEDDNGLKEVFLLDGKQVGKKGVVFIPLTENTKKPFCTEGSIKENNEEFVIEERVGKEEDTNEE